MKYYLSVVCDRRVYPEYRLFASHDAAIAHTRKAFHDTVAHPDGITEVDALDGGRLLLLQYEYESDYAEVVEVEVSD